MKKTLIVLMMVLLAAMLVISCNNKTKATYTVSFNSNGGSKVDSADVIEGEKVPLPANPTKNDSIFAGWTTDQAGKNAYDFGSAVSGNITLYAQWADVPTLAGESVELGTYPDDYAVTGLRGQNITWRALAIDNSARRVLLISENVLEKRVFDSDSSSYTDSDIRTYLNGDFITEYGLEYISIENVDVTTDLEVTTAGSGNDKVFLLSRTEAEDESYFSTGAARSATYNNASSAWYLRTYDARCFYKVETTGVFTPIYDVSTSDGIRPAFWVKY